MRRIRSTDTKPEKVVRSLLHRMGYRFRLHQNGLPGRPDIVLARHRKVVFVHGCFWHQHSGCREGRVPGSRPEYWGPKLTGNVMRDERHLQALLAAGWGTLVIWECEVSRLDEVEMALSTFLEG